MAEFLIKPVRRKNGHVGPWILTDKHRAQMWALCRGEKQLMRFSTFDKAAKSVTAAKRAYEGLVDRYELGKRMPKKEFQK